MDIGVLTRATRGPLAREHRDRPAISVLAEQTWTYGELDDTACRFANALLELGVRRGDRVALLMSNSLEYVAAYLAVTSLGCVAVRVNFRLKREELEYVLTDSGSRILLVDDQFLDVVEAVRATVPVEHYVVFCPAGDEAPDWALPADTWAQVAIAAPDVGIPAAEDPAALIYTSGTTGVPKGAVWTHGNTMWAAAAQAMLWRYHGQTVAMTTGPLYHVGGLEDLIMPCLLMRGHAVITPSGDFRIERVLVAIERQQVGEVFLFPFMLYEILERSLTERYDLSSLRHIVTGGSVLLPWAVRELRMRLPHTHLCLGYGLTEGGAMATMPEYGVTEDTADTAGKPIPGVEVRICDEAGNQLPENLDGEVWVRGPAVATSYWNNPEATAETFRDGWCRTGDIGRITRGGLLQLTGRAKDMIRTGGENVYPAEVEAVVANHPAVLDAAVIGVPDSRFQEAVCAVVVPRPGKTVEPGELIRYVTGRLAGYKKPTHVVVLDELPRNPSGKVLKYVLRERYAGIGR